MVKIVDLLLFSALECCNQLRSSPEQILTFFSIFLHIFPQYLTFSVESESTGRGHTG